MSLKTGNSRRVAKSRPVCMGLKTNDVTELIFPLRLARTNSPSGKLA
jgi:hypothetical protein